MKLVFIPGAWCGAWAWHPVAQRLTRLGHDAVTFTLPGLEYGDGWGSPSLADATSMITGQIEARGLVDVVLVSHSWGGYPATGAAHALGGRISRVIYYNAMVPEPNRAMVDDAGQFGEIVRQTIASSTDGTFVLARDAAAHVLMPDAEPRLQNAIADLLVPQPGRYMTDPYRGRPASELDCPVSYVHGAEDTALGRPPAEYAARAGTEPTVIAGTHMTLMTAPDEVAKALLQTMTEAVVL